MTFITAYGGSYARGDTNKIQSEVEHAYTAGTLGTAQETIPYVYGGSNNGSIH